MDVRIKGEREALFVEKKRSSVAYESKPVLYFIYLFLIVFAIQQILYWNIHYDLVLLV